MSTSYGPGRYDAAYEVEGHDYPFGYVRWTLNRNMQAYLDLHRARAASTSSRSIDRVIPVDEAPAAYRALADGRRRAAARGADPISRRHRELPKPAEPTRVVIRGHRTAPAGPLNYALVGAGAFGMAMLVPQMKKRRDRFFLQGVVSRNGIAGRELRAREPGGDPHRRSRRRSSTDPGIRSRRDRDAPSRARRSGRARARGGQARVRRETAGAHLGRARSDRDASMAASPSRRC